MDYQVTFDTLNNWWKDTGVQFKMGTQIPGKALTCSLVTNPPKYGTEITMYFYGNSSNNVGFVAVFTKLNFNKSLNTLLAINEFNSKHKGYKALIEDFDSFSTLEITSERLRCETPEECAAVADRGVLFMLDDEVAPSIKKIVDTHC